MEVTAGMIICGVGAGGIVISVIVLLVTFSLCRTLMQRTGLNWHRRERDGERRKNHICK